MTSGFKGFEIVAKPLRVLRPPQVRILSSPLEGVRNLRAPFFICDINSSRDLIFSGKRLVPVLCQSLIKIRSFYGKNESFSVSVFRSVSDALGQIKEDDQNTDQCKA